MDTYSTRRGHIRFHPGLTSEEFPLNEYFADLQLVPVLCKYKELKQSYDLLCLQDYADRSYSNVLVSGQDGVGKTRMISELAYQWAIKRRRCTKRLSFKITKSTDNMQFLHKFEYVFLVDLRKCKPDMCLVDAIESQLIANVSKQHLQEFLTNHSSECLYLFDGYDEISVNDKVLKSDLLCNSHVIVTTRPNKVELFCENHKEYAKVISEGLSETSIARFVKTYFINSKTTSDRLLKTIWENPVVKNLARYPLLLSMICGVWKSGSEFPSTISELYYQAIDQLVHHMKAHEPQFASMSSEEFQNRIKIDQIMVHIGKIAFHGLLQNSKQIFKEEEFSSSEMVDQALLLGILSKGSKVSDTEVEYISFAQKTFQEYCAAVYLSSVAESDDQELLKSYLSQMDLSDMEYVLRFCCGTSQKAAQYVLTYVAEVYKIEIQKRPSTDGVLRQICRLPLLLLFETESKFGIVDQLHNILSSSLVNMIMYVTDDPVYRAALTYFIRRFDTQKVWTECVHTAIVYMHCGIIGGHDDHACKCEKHLELLAKMPNLKKVTIEHLSLDEKYRVSIDKFDFEYIKGLTNSLEELTLKNYRHIVNETCEFVDELSHDIQFHFDCLEAGFNDWSISDTEKLSNLLQIVHSRGGSIRKVELARFLRKHEEEDCNMEKVIEHVTPFCAVLEKIRLYRIGNGLTKECVDTLCDGITQAGRRLSSQDSTCDEFEEVASKISDQPNEYLPLQELDLAGNPIAPSISNVCGIFLFLGRLNRLNLWCCDLMENDFQVLGPALSNLPNLQHINLRGNTVGNSLEALIQGINHSKLIRIDLGDTKMTTESKLNISQLRLPLIKHMNLSDNDIDSCEAEALAVALKHMPQLIELDLPFNSIGSDGAKALLESFQSTPHREDCQVNLEHNKIKCIALQPSQSLSGPTYLNLNNNEIDSDGAAALASSFRYMPQMEKLDISENPIGPEGLEALFRKLHHLPKLSVFFQPAFPVDNSPTKLTKLTGKLTAVLQHRRGSPSCQTLIQACIESLKQKGIWRNSFYCKGVLVARHIQEIVRVVAMYPSKR